MSESPKRGYRNFLTLDAIVAEARSVADAEGLDAISMRTLANRLGCTPRALYRHVSDKDEVLELLFDSALANLALQTDVGWQTALFDFFSAMYEELVAAPAVAAIIARQAVVGDQFRSLADSVVALLLDAGFTPDVAVEALVALAQFTLGASLPGTAQQLHDIYQTRELGDDLESMPALAYVRQHFASESAGTRYRTALRRIIHAYEDAAQP